jgi:hypothetical protein
MQAAAELRAERAEFLLAIALEVAKHAAIAHRATEINHRFAMADANARIGGLQRLLDEWHKPAITVGDGEE